MPPRNPEPPRRRTYGTGTVTRLDTQTWRAQLPRAVDPARQSRRFPTRREAEDWLADRLDRFARGVEIDAGLLPLGEYADDWLKRHAWDDGTERAYRVRRAHLALLDAVTLADLRPSHVERVLAEMRKRGLSERFMRLVAGLLSSILQSAIRDGILTVNVVERVALPKLPQAETVVLSEVEARHLLRVSEGTRWHAVWWVLLAVGLRSGEVRGLRRDDVDLDGGRIRVRRSASTPHRIGATKGRRERWVPIPPACVAAIRAHLELVRAGADVPARGRRPGAPNARTVAATPWLFPSHATGRPYPANTLRAHLRAGLAAAGVDPIRVHDLRHSAATFMIARGRPLPIVAEILGHRSSAITAGLYAHVLSGQHREVADTMGDVLSDSKSGRSADELAQPKRDTR